MLNQYPDIEADTDAGRRHFPIAYGVQHSNAVYALFTIAAALSLLVSIEAGILTTTSSLALIPIVFSVYAFLGVRKYGESIGKHPKYLAANVMATISIPLVLAITIILDA